MNRKLLRAVSAAMLAVPGTAAALGLGPIDVRSALDQPLYAEIPILAAGPSALKQLSAGLAPPDLFDRLGLEHPPVLSGVNVRVAGIDGAAPHIVVTSRSAMREPLLNLVVDVRWPGGRLLRDFAVLLDPPNALRPTPTRRTAVAGTGLSSSVPAPGFDGNNYLVASGDTLWRIATAARPDTSVTIHQMVMALFKANPEAFFAPDINSLSAGANLRIPSREEIEAIGRAQARAEVRRQLGLTGPSSVATTETSPDEPGARTSAAAEKPSEQLPSLRLVDAQAVGAADASTELPLPAADVPGVESPGANPLIRLEGEGVGLQLAGMDELETRLPPMVGVEDMALAAGAVSDAVDAALAATQGADASVDDAVVAPAAESPKPAEVNAEPTLTAAETGVSGAKPAVSESQSVAPAPEETNAVQATDQADAAGAGAPSTAAIPAAETVAGGAPPSEATESDAATIPVPSAEVSGDAASAAGDATTPPAASTTVPATATPEAATESDAGTLAKVTGWLRETRDGLLQDPRRLAIGGGALLVLALAALAALRRRKGRAAEPAPDAAASVIATTRASAPMAPPVREDVADEIGHPEQPREASPPAQAASAPEPEPTATVAQARERVDNVKHADFLMAMGQYDDAAELLRESLEEEPERDALRLKLLECLREHDDAHQFSALAERDRERLIDAGLWPQVEQLAQGFAVLATAPGSQASQIPTEAEAEPDEAFDLGEIDRALMAESAAESADLESDEALDRTVEAELRKLEEQSLVETQDADVISFEEFQWQRAAGDDVASSLDANPLADTSQQPLDNWEIDTPASEHEADADRDDEQSFVETKLDLARAYLEMGDDAGARTLFEEVLEEGDQDQQETAQAALRRLG